MVEALVGDKPGVSDGAAAPVGVVAGFVAGVLRAVRAAAGFVGAVGCSAGAAPISAVARTARQRQSPIRRMGPVVPPRRLRLR
jgi:hypothetical protein